MKKTIQICLLFLKMRSREPLELVWNVLFPCLVLLSLVISWDFKVNSKIHMITYGSIMSWVTMQWSVSGVGCYLVDWRECGMLKSFAQDKRSRQQLISSLILAQVVLFTPFLFCSFLLLYTLGIDLGSINLFEYHLKSYGLLIVFSFGSILLNSLPFSSANMNTFVSICFLPLTLLASLESSEWDFVNAFNPIHISAVFLSSDIMFFDSVRWPFLISISILFGTIGLLKFRNASNVRR